jgi:restriction endonuclease S subunit
VTLAWEFAPLRALASVFTDGDWIESKDQSPEGIRLVQTGNVGEGEYLPRLERARYVSADTFRRLNCTEVFAGDCLISRLPDPVGRSCLLPALDERAITVVDCTVVRFLPQRVDPKFFVYYSRSCQYLRAVNNVCTGTTRHRVSRSRLGELRVPVPSLAEQRRIVAKLDEAFGALDTGLSALQRASRRTEDLSQALAGSALTPRRGWRELPLGDLCVVDWGNTDLTKAAYTEDGEFLAVSASGCDGRIRHREHARHTPVLSAIGAQCGRMFLPDEDFTAIKNTITLTPRSGLSSGRFLFWLVAHASLPKRGAAQPFIAKGDVEAFRVRVPTDVREQESLADRIGELTQACAVLSLRQQHRLREVEDLKRSLLHQAFTGAL